MVLDELEASARLTTTELARNLGLCAPVSSDVGAA